MSAKLLRPYAEQIFASNDKAMGGIAVPDRKPFTRWPGFSAIELKSANRIASVEWKRGRLPCRGEDWWRKNW